MGASAFVTSASLFAGAAGAAWLSDSMSA